MKSIDTNILIRFLTRDDEDQFLRVLTVMSEMERAGENLLITNLVLLETVWVLTSIKNYPGRMFCQPCSA